MGEAYSEIQLKDCQNFVKLLGNLKIEAVCF